METSDLTVRVLIEIRDEIKKTRNEIKKTNERVEHLEQSTNARFEETNTRLDHFAARVTESELRTATAITGMHGTLQDVHKLLSDQLDLRPRVEKCEREIDALKRRKNLR